MSEKSVFEQVAAFQLRALHAFVEVQMAAVDKIPGATDEQKKLLKQPCEAMLKLVEKNPYYPKTA